MNQVNRRHNSLFNPTEKPQISSPLKTNCTSNDNSAIQYNEAKMKLRTDTLFAFPESDNHINSIEEIDDNIVDQINRLVDENSNNKGSSSNESNHSDEEIDLDTNRRTNKRRSECIMMPQLPNFITNNPEEPYFNINCFNNSNNVSNLTNSSKAEQTMNFLNINNISPKKYRNWGQNQVNVYNFRTYSLMHPVPFAVGGTMPLKNGSNICMDNSSQFYMSSMATPNHIPIQQPFIYQNRGNDDQSFFNDLFSLLKEQNSCRQVQDKLEERKNDFEFMKQFFNLLKDTLVDIIKDKFGNYVMQKFIEVLIIKRNSRLFFEFFYKIRNYLFNISIHEYGSCFFQKTLEKLDNDNYLHIKSKEVNDIFKEFIQKFLFNLCYDKNGNHVFQKILKIYPKDENEFIYQELGNYAVDISKLSQSVNILKTVFKHSLKRQKDELVYKILLDIEDLINDEYGNFVIQFIIELKEKEYNDIIYNYIRMNILSLSKMKFSSNVIDKSIIKDYEYSSDLVKYIIDKNMAKDMIIDRYGNYVVQKALETSDAYLFKSLIQQIEPMLATLKQSPLGENIYNHLIKNYGNHIQNAQLTNLNNLHQVNNNSANQSDKDKMSKQNRR